MSTRISRRGLLRRGLGAAAALASPVYVPSVVLGLGAFPGANERVQLAVVGMGARGQNLIGNVPGTARVAAMCDCSRSRLKRAFEPKGKFAAILADFLEGPDSKNCKTYQDVRRLLDREKLDGLMVCTPDHNHAWISMLALQAGLDLYLEKPITLTIAEGKQLVEATRRSGRIVQVGSQQRSMEMNIFACEFLRDGGLGKISHVDARNLPGPMVHAPLPVEEVPEGLDWDLFCGPRPLRPYNRKRWIKDVFRVDGVLWRGWDLWRDYSGHLTTNWGAHGFDMAQYALGQDDSGPVDIEVEKPEEILPLAQEFAYKTPIDRELGLSPENERRFWPVTLRYASGVEIRLRPGVKRMTFHGETGRMAISRNSYKVEPARKLHGAPDSGLVKRWQGPGHVARPHVQNWLDCMRTRRRPRAPIDVGHRSNSVCLLINLARELGRNLRWDPTEEKFPGDDEANALLERPRREGYELAEV